LSLEWGFSFYSSKDSILYLCAKQVFFLLVTFLNLTFTTQLCTLTRGSYGNTVCVSNIIIKNFNAYTHNKVTRNTELYVVRYCSIPSYEELKSLFLVSQLLILQIRC
jgi:hypothetical protein